jgi:protein ImuA
MIDALQKEIFLMQGRRILSDAEKVNTGLGTIEAAFAEGVFPVGAVHEFISKTMEDSAATNGFISGILGRLMQQDGMCVWVSNKRRLFPAAIAMFGISPDRIIFIDLKTEREALWTIEEALKCEALSAVIGEISELSFTQSRRLQLAVEDSNVTGFIHRFNPRVENTVACVSRWKITPLHSEAIESMPGIGYPKWYVQLIKARNGKPGNWEMGWSQKGFYYPERPLYATNFVQTSKAV